MKNTLCSITPSFLSFSAFHLFGALLIQETSTEGRRQSQGSVPSGEVYRGHKKRISNLTARVVLSEAETAMLNDNLIKFN